MSREKQIDEIAKLICTYPQCTYYNIIGGCEARECIIADNAEKIYNAGYRKQEWISVDERLPEESGEYLVFGRTFGNKKPQIWICECISIGSVMGWCNSAKNPIVEAWMPLPEAPKMKGGVTAESAIRAVQEAALELKNTPPDNLLGIGSTMQF